MAENKQIVKQVDVIPAIFQTANAFLAESPEFIDRFVKNLGTYCILNNAEITETEVIFTTKNGTFNYAKDRFVLEMYKATREGLELLKKDFSITPFKAGEKFIPTIIVNYDKRMRVLTELGYRIEFIHVLQGDEFVEVKPFFHTWKIKPKINRVTPIVAGLPKNDVIFYGVAIYKGENLVCSYFESELNIKIRRKSASDSFAQNPNAFHRMNEKFILNLAYNHIRQCYGLKTPDFDMIENYAEYAEVVDDENPKIPEKLPEKKPELLKDSKTWAAMQNAIKNGKVQSIEAIEAKYQVAEENKSEILALFAELENEKQTETQNEKTENNEKI